MTIFWWWGWILEEFLSLKDHRSRSRAKVRLPCFPFIVLPTRVWMKHTSCQLVTVVTAWDKENPLCFWKVTVRLSLTLFLKLNGKRDSFWNPCCRLPHFPYWEWKKPFKAHHYTHKNTHTNMHLATTCVFTAAKGNLNREKKGNITP